MPARPHPIPVIRTIRFSRGVAARSAELPDWVLCDAIANGRREVLGTRGAHGGALIRFERAFAQRINGLKLPEIRVRVLAEVTRRECVALRVLAPAAGRRKNSDLPGFLHRPGLK